MCQECDRLHQFIIHVADRLFLAAEVLAIRAERRKPTALPAPEEG